MTETLIIFIENAILHQVKICFKEKKFEIICFKAFKFKFAAIVKKGTHIRMQYIECTFCDRKGLQLWITTQKYVGVNLIAVLRYVWKGQSSITTTH